ncbi:putative toxin-antitoxin system toxin component, PIN family [Thiocapsa sp. UBA6158]|jgi:putative PIN family toxin of toxin-antitoxin system|uniref:putative toxin-antitoxin system toxin component, PIN family n=1 Tax=Thiocapsa sp. UBA6158 TaxID=1947692 RepID=UPI0025EC8816|nr:putative toxin-antitoxin system toxin component, PIN family [Thiocapsa sp. UBA6158]
MTGSTIAAASGDDARTAWANNAPRVVVDTSVLVAGLRSRNGASFQLLASVTARCFVPLLSVPLFLEYESVLKRQEQRVVHGLSIADIDAILNTWAALGEPIRLHYLWRPQLRDSDDEMVLETAINGRANAIITHNTTDFRPAAERFALDVLTPAQIIARLRREP